MKALTISYVRRTHPHSLMLIRVISSKHEPLIRQDIRDGMDGVPLTLDIGVMDVTTCTVIENAMVDICKCSPDYPWPMTALKYFQGIAMFVKYHSKQPVSDSNLIHRLPVSTRALSHLSHQVQATHPPPVDPVDRP